jgi:hypothetical protein
MTDTSHEALRAGVALLPELRRETTFLANDKTLLLRREIEVIIAALEAAERIAKPALADDYRGHQTMINILREYAASAFGRDEYDLCDVLKRAANLIEFLAAAHTPAIPPPSSP